MICLSELRSRLIDAQGLSPVSIRTKQQREIADNSDPQRIRISNPQNAEEGMSIDNRTEGMYVGRLKGMVKNVGMLRAKHATQGKEKREAQNEG